MHLVNELKNTPIMTKFATKSILNAPRSTSRQDMATKAMVLARHMMKQFKANSIPFTASQVFKTAWAHIQTNDNLRIVYFTRHNKAGEIIEHCKRVVDMDPTGHVTFKGTGRPLKVGQRLWVDWARKLTKDILNQVHGPANVKLSIIGSTYEDRITAIY